VTGDDEEEDRPDSPTSSRSVQLLGPAGLTIGNAPGSQSGCLVVKVRRGNGGDRAGIKVGDRILRVNGTDVNDHAVCVQFIERRCRVGDCEVEVCRRAGLGVGGRVSMHARG
jgi:hypothetical protein